MSIIYNSMKPVTIKAVRALYSGCLLAAYFDDSETPVKYVVVEQPDAHASHWDIKVVPYDGWKKWLPPGSDLRRYQVRFLNTDRWTLLGEVA